MSTVVPAASSFPRPLKRGYLTELVGRRWFFQPVWKRRFCVLNGNTIYLYDQEDSTGEEGTVICLQEFDVCQEQNYNRTSHVFVLTTSSKHFFQVCHVFSADSEPEMCDWIAAICGRLSQRPLAKKPSSRRLLGARRQTKSQGPDVSETFEGIQLPGALPSITKSRPRGPSGRRLPQRKSQVAKSMAAVNSSQLPTVLEPVLRNWSNDASCDSSKKSSSQVDEAEDFFPQPRQATLMGNTAQGPWEHELRIVGDKIEVLEDSMEMVRGDLRNLQDNVSESCAESLNAKRGVDQIAERLLRCEKSLEYILQKVDLLFQQQLVREDKSDEEQESREPTGLITEVSSV
ncbi:uncharacterized protein LOC135374465 [Ornithodoros turicata]|uniref:uncharacterized protein LOC135374465 n=1 Tax=Ornithodoros turicata TaxID=34597 RepID=UPI003139BAA9